MDRDLSHTAARAHKAEKKNYRIRTEVGEKIYFLIRLKRNFLNLSVYWNFLCILQLYFSKLQMGFHSSILQLNLSILQLDLSVLHLDLSIL